MRLFVACSTLLVVLALKPLSVWSRRLGGSSSQAHDTKAENKNNQSNFLFDAGRRQGQMPDFPPWNSKAKPVVTCGQDEGFMYESDKVRLSPDGFTMTSGYAIQGRQDNFFYPASYHMKTYTYVHETHEWIPVDTTLHIDLPPPTEGREGTFPDMIMASNTLGFNAWTIIDDRGRPDPWNYDDDDDDGSHVKLQGQVRVWSLTNCIDQPALTTCWRELQPALQNAGDEQDKEFFGISLAIADETTDKAVTVAVGIPTLLDDTIGRVEVYRYNPNGDDFWEHGQWDRLGSDIQGDNGSFGQKVSLSRDGTVLGVMSYVPSDDEDNRCSLGVFQLDDDSRNWVQIGQSLSVGDNENNDLKWCTTLAVSGDGMTIVLGSSVSDPGCPEVPKPKGQVRLWSYNQDSRSWQQKGSDLNTLVELIRPVEYYEIGFEVALSHDGNRVAMSVTESLPGDGLDVVAYVLSFEWDGSEWEQVGTRVQVPGAFRFSASMSQDGNTLVTSFQDVTKRVIVESFRWTESNKETGTSTVMENEAAEQVT